MVGLNAHKECRPGMTCNFLYISKISHKMSPDSDKVTVALCYTKHQGDMYLVQKVQLHGTGSLIPNVYLKFPCSLMTIILFKFLKAEHNTVLGSNKFINGAFNSLQSPIATYGWLLHWFVRLGHCSFSGSRFRRHLSSQS